ncbi:MAG: family 16 glycosylhydrolase [Candidatus Krumholzibacteriia bacterium]
MKTIALTLAGLALCVGLTHAQVGALIWADDFQDLDNWLILTGNGSWGWGNGELEYYATDNVGIADVPGEPGNTALRITARHESGPGIVDQVGTWPLSCTSSKVISKSKVTVRYGMIEARVKVPDLDLGGWPAVWLLGNANYAWPRNGEIDMMEMGGKQAYRPARRA